MLEVARMLEQVRGDLDRRRNQQVDVVAIVPRSTRLGSHAGLAPTEMAHAAPQRRWQYAVGVLALCASGLLFLLSRAGDSRAASAATVSGAAYTRTDTTLDKELAATRATQPKHAPTQVDYAMADAPLVTEELDAAAPAPVQATTKPRTASPKSPAAPRRGPTKIVDPDGTIDSY